MTDIRGTALKLDSDPDILVQAKAPPRDPSQLYLLVNGTEYSGWDRTQVSLRCDGFPNSFSCSLSAPPWQKLETVAKAGDDCAVLLGHDQVIRGWVDRDVHSGSDQTHAIQIIGRGHTQDLVDCSAVWDGALISGDCFTVASQLGKAYAVGALLLGDADPGPHIPQMALNYGESSADIIQRLARNAGLLAYENGAGQLVFAKPGYAKAASGVKVGANVLTWSVSHGMDQRYSEIDCTLTSIFALGDVKSPTDPENATGSKPASDFFFTANDPNVKRFRRLNLIADSSVPPDGDPYEFTRRRARWEVARRLGQSVQLVATVDSWRDAAGKLWAPNTLVDVDVPGSRAGTPLIVVSVDFERSVTGGTSATLVLAPPEALSIQPISLLQADIADIEPPPS